MRRSGREKEGGRREEKKTKQKKLKNPAPPPYYLMHNRLLVRFQSITYLPRYDNSNYNTTGMMILLSFRSSRIFIFSLFYYHWKTSGNGTGHSPRPSPSHFPLIYEDIDSLLLSLLWMVVSGE